MLMDVSGMSNLTTALSSVLTLDNFMGALSALIPVIGGVLIFAFIYRITRKVVKKAPQGKVGI